jgi:hypothetical protein
VPTAYSLSHPAKSGKAIVPNQSRILSSCLRIHYGRVAALFTISYIEVDSV